MGADACPVLVGEGSWLFVSIEKLTTEAPVNGGRNYLLTEVVIKFGYMLETLDNLTILVLFVNDVNKSGRTNRAFGTCEKASGRGNQQEILLIYIGCSA